MKMQLKIFVDGLIPGDKELGAPKFSAVAWPQFQEESDFLARLSVVFNDFQNNTAGCAFSENNEGDLGKESNECKESRECNEAMLKSFSAFFKEKHSTFYVEFKEVVMGLYFSSPAVLVAMGEVEIPLFPRGQSLPAFNNEMLESVYNRGEIWRSVNKH